MAEEKTEEKAKSAWTDEQVELLRALWGQGMTASEISEAIGFSKNAVIGKAHRLGLAGRPSPIKKKGAARSLSLLALTERMCRWPFGDPGRPDFHFCGRAVEVSATYCGEHRAIAFQATRKPLTVAKE